MVDHDRWRGIHLSSGGWDEDSMTAVIHSSQSYGTAPFGNDPGNPPSGEGQSNYNSDWDYSIAYRRVCWKVQTAGLMCCHLAYHLLGLHGSPNWLLTCVHGCNAERLQKQVRTISKCAAWTLVAPTLTSSSRCCPTLDPCASSFRSSVSYQVGRETISWP